MQFLIEYGYDVIVAMARCYEIASKTRVLPSVTEHFDRRIA